MNFGALILAAGYSSRMGDFKPLLHIGGKSVLSHGIHLFRAASIEKIVVVTGHRHQDVTRAVHQEGSLAVHNTNFAQGMFSSVCTGLPHLKSLDGFFVLPVDTPLVRAATLEILARAFNGSQVLFPCRDGIQGHPPLIPSSMIAQIMDSSATGGLRQILATLPGQAVEVWDDGAFMDMDTPEDLSRMRQRFELLTKGSRREVEALAHLTMPPKGIRHGQEVARVADRIARTLVSCGCRLDLEIVHNSALLHDIAKGQADHEIRGGKLMHRLGLHDLADAVASHRDVVTTSGNHPSERDIVCLADKLVSGCQRVSLQERFQQKLDLYHEDKTACEAIHCRLRNALLLRDNVEQLTGISLETLLQEP